MSRRQSNVSKLAKNDPTIVDLDCDVAPNLPNVILASDRHYARERLGEPCILTREVKCSLSNDINICFHSPVSAHEKNFADPEDITERAAVAISTIALTKETKYKISTVSKGSGADHKILDKNGLVIGHVEVSGTIAADSSAFNKRIWAKYRQTSGLSLAGGQIFIGIVDFHHKRMLLTERGNIK